MTKRTAHILALLAAIAIAPLQSQARISPSSAIALPGVEGRIDHLAIDLPGRRLFVAALGNNSLEILDLASFTVTHSIRGLSQPQGVAYVGGVNKLYVANAGTGECVSSTEAPTPC